MADEVEELIVSVRADTRAFARDIETMRGELEGPLAQGAMRAGRQIERSLARALKDGRLEFGELRKIALQALDQIVNAAARSLIAPGGTPGAGGGIGQAIGGLLSGLLGAPGRATGGPVSAQRPYRVGENGPEWFVPQSAGRVERIGAGSGEMKVNIAIQSSGGHDEPTVMRQSARQVAAAIRQAMKNA